MNPIDQHFSKNLKELEVKPSDRANRLFSEKMNKKHRPAWKYWAMAASVILVVGIAIRVSTHTFLPQDDQTAAEIQAQLPIIQEKQELAQELATPEEEAEDTTLTEATIEVIKTIAQITPNVNKEEEAIKTTPVVKTFQVASIQPKINYKYERPNLIDYTIVDAVPKEIELPKEDFEEKISRPATKEKSLLGKIIKEAQYALNGEKVDLDRSGIRPAVINLAHQKAQVIAEDVQDLSKIKKVFK